MSREDELRQELLRRLESDTEMEAYERSLHPFARVLLERGVEVGHVFDSELTDYVTGSLQADRADDVRAHIAECRECRERVEREAREMEALDRHYEQRAHELQQARTNS